MSGGHRADIPRRIHGKARWTCLIALVALATATLPGTPARSGSVPVEPYRLPVDRQWLDRGLILRPHHDHPAWDMNLPVGTPAYAVQAGKVRAVLTASGCGLGVVIDGADGLRYTYCHASRVTTSAGRVVHSGQQILRTGNSGSSGQPHLHLEIEQGAALTLICPQPLLLSWWRGRAMSPYDAPKRGCTY